MGYIPVAAAVVYILVLLYCVPEFLRRKTRENGVYLPGAFFWVGAVCGAFFAVLDVLGRDTDGFTVAIFTAFVVLSVLILLGWRNCYILYDREGFSQRNLIGMWRRFRYDQVTGWDPHPGNPTESTVYALGKKITFNMLSPNSVGFLIALKKGYRSTHGGKPLPANRQTKHKTGFRAHVRNSGEFLFIFVLLIVFIVGMGGWCAWMICQPLDGADCETLSVTFQSCWVEDGELMLTAEGYEEVFEIRGFPEFVPMAEELPERCDGQTVFEAQARKVTPDDGPDYYWIQALRADGQDYLTLEDTTAYNRTNLSVLLWFFVGFLVIWLALSGLVYLVGCNPAKYPKWLVNGLFKKGYIEY